MNKNQLPQANPEALIPDADLQPVMQARLDLIATAVANTAISEGKSS